MLELSSLNYVVLLLMLLTGMIMTVWLCLDLSLVVNVKDSNTCLKFFKPNLNQQTGMFVSAFFFLVVTLMGLFAVSNMLNLYMILEVYSLAFYLLILSMGYKFLTSGLSSALFQYLIINSILSGAFWMLMVMMIMKTGFIDFSNLWFYFKFSLDSWSYWALVGSLLLFFKLGMFPFFFWMPQIYSNMEWQLLLMIAMIPQGVFLMLLLKLMNLGIFYFDRLNFVIYIMGLASMAMSSMNLLNPSSLTTFLAWSSIGVSGQIICLLPSLNCGLSLMIMVIAYSMNFVAILATWQLKDYHSVYVICLMILFFALAGIPPLSMFIAKLWMIQVISPAYWLILLFILHWTINSMAYLKYMFQNM